MEMFENDMPVVGHSRPRQVTLSPWYAVREKVRRLVGDDAYEAWFEGLRFVEIDGACAVMATPKRTVGSWITKRYIARLRLAWIATYPEVTSVRIDASSIQPIASLIASVVTPEAPAKPLHVDEAELKALPSDYVRIQRIIEVDFGLSRGELLSRTSAYRVSRPRQLAMYFAMQHVRRATLVGTGRHFGGRDHTCVRQALMRVNTRIRFELDFAERVERLREIVLTAIAPKVVVEMPAAEAAE